MFPRSSAVQCSSGAGFLLREWRTLISHCTSLLEVVVVSVVEGTMSKFRLVKGGRELSMAGSGTTKRSRLNNYGARRNAKSVHARALLKLHVCVFPSLFRVNRAFPCEFRGMLAAQSGRLPQFFGDSMAFLKFQLELTSTTEFPLVLPLCQENLWRPIVKDPVNHEDGTVTVHYEVPAGNNECLELSKRITPLVRPVGLKGCAICNLLDSKGRSYLPLCLAVGIDSMGDGDVVELDVYFNNDRTPTFHPPAENIVQDIESKELQICRGEVPHQINILAEVAACLSALAMHSPVLKLFAPSGVLGPFVMLSLDQLVPRETCLTALLDTPVKAYRYAQRHWPVSPSLSAFFTRAGH